MNTEKNIRIAFLLNLSFSLLECIGGVLTGSIAILSDAVHDLGDAVSIGLSFLLEKHSRKQPDHTHTYGYVRYSVLGSAVTTLFLLSGSAAVFCQSVRRLVSPVEVQETGMMLLAVIGICINACAAYFTREGDSLNRRAVRLHMLEDVLGWAAVLAGAVVMHFTGFTFLDPLLSMGVSVFIFVHAAGSLREILDLFLEKTPRSISVSELQEHLTQIDGIRDVHHIHLRSLDGQDVYAEMHIVTDADPVRVKAEIRQELQEHGIVHATLELESAEESCVSRDCRTNTGSSPAAVHHHHH